MKLLVIGNGGREHAIAWRLAQSDRVEKVYVAPGNAGTALCDGLENLPIIDAHELIAFAKANGIDFTVVGPEARSRPALLISSAKPDLKFSDRRRQLPDSRVRRILLRPS